MNRFGKHSSSAIGDYDIDELIKLLKNVENLPCFKIDNFVFAGSATYWLKVYLVENERKELTTWLKDKGLLLTTVKEKS